MKKLLPLIATLITVLLAGCSSESPEKEPITTKITGLAEKGPFKKGATVTLYELDEKLESTSNSFKTTVTDDLGTFEFDQITFHSPYVKIVVGGSYFNEVNGSVNDSPITLSAYSVVQPNKPINVNILTHLESERVKHLINQANLSFDQAKSQAQREVLSAFSMNQSIAQSQAISITSNSDGAGVMVAISALILNLDQDISLTETLNQLTNDLTPDGKLDDKTIQDQLAISSNTLNTWQISENLTNHYKSSGKEIKVPDISKYLPESTQPEKLPPIKLAVKLVANPTPANNITTDPATDRFIDKFALNNVDIMIFTDIKTSMMQKVFGQRVTNVTKEAINLEIPGSVIKQNGNSEEFAIIAVANNTWNYAISYQGNFFDLMSKCDTRWLNEFNLTSLADYDMSKAFSPARNFPGCSMPCKVKLMVGKDNKIEIQVQRTIVKVRVRFKENPNNPEVESVTIKNVNIASTIEGKPVDSGTNHLVQQCNLSSGACFYLFPGEGFPTFEIKTKDKTITQTLDFPSMFDANTTHIIELDLMK